MDQIHKINVRVDPGAYTPKRASKGSAGYDLFTHRPIRLFPGERITVKLGIYFDIPEGLEGQIRPRSGLAANSGITVLNSPGTIDSDFSGEIGVILLNTSETLHEFDIGHRIAQIVFAPVPDVTLIANELDELDAEVEWVRGASGFGSSGA